MHDLCAIIVSDNGKRGLDAALIGLFAHVGRLYLDVVVVDNGSDGSADYVEDRFPGVRTIRCPNRSFGYAGNRALETVSSRYVLFLDPNAKLLAGSLDALTAALDRQPEVALAGARQLRADGSLVPSIKSFPSARRMLTEAFAMEKVPGVGRMLGEREPDPGSYDRETACDWIAGSLMLIRRTALESCGRFDEQLSPLSGRIDLCWRLKQAGWEIVHMPYLTFDHHEQRGTSAQLKTEAAYARTQFARKRSPRRAGSPWPAVRALGLRRRS